MRLSVVILTFNEERNLPQCLESLRRLDCPVYIIDSGSTDGTLRIAHEYGATVLQHAFRTHAEQWAWGLKNLPQQPEWVIGLDSDQSLTPELAEELHRTFAGEIPNEVAGFYINRRQIFRGSWIRHGGYYPKYLLKVFRPDRVFFDAADFLDHHFYVPGPTIRLKHDMVENNLKEYDIGFWIRKHEHYAGLVAAEEYARRTTAAGAPLQPKFFGNPDQRSLMLKSWWRKLPLFVRPVLYFGYRYFVQGGWMDGKQGFIFHFCHALWFRVLVDAKLDELLASDVASAGREVMVNTQA
jgi:glycosyltransferase involved in cell wall biosynthesis